MKKVNLSNSTGFNKVRYILGDKLLAFVVKVYPPIRAEKAANRIHSPAIEALGSSSGNTGDKSGSHEVAVAAACNLWKSMRTPEELLEMYAKTSKRLFTMHSVRPGSANSLQVWLVRPEPVFKTRNISER